MAAVATEDFAFALVCTALDPDFYRRAYPDIDQAGVDPFAHYAEAGWREGRDPAPWFSTADYLNDNPDVAMLDVNPLAHYLRVGASEGSAGCLLFAVHIHLDLRIQYHHPNHYSQYLYTLAHHTELS